MPKSPEKFAQLLTEALYKIRIVESRTIKKTVSLVQDELGYALGRDGGSCIEYWRKGHVPARLDDIELLARTLVLRTGLDRTGLVEFLRSAGYPNPGDLVDELFPIPFLQTGPRAVQTSALAFSEYEGKKPAAGVHPEELAAFVIGPPITHPRQFFGREQELQRIFGLWKRFPLQNVAVIGLHRTGKTSLLRYLADIATAAPVHLRPGQRTNWLPQPERYQWVYIDFQDIRMANMDRLLRYILTNLNIPVPELCNLNNFMDLVSEQLQRPAIVMMDEIGAGLASPELDQQFWWSLRSLSSNFTGGKLAFLLTAHQSPALLAHEHGKPSPFFNIFGHTITLGPLTDAEARELVASSPIPFAPEDIEWILAQSERWPALLQILGDTRLTTLQEGQSGYAWRAAGLRRLEPFQYLLE